MYTDIEPTADDKKLIKKEFECNFCHNKFFCDIPEIMDFIFNHESDYESYLRPSRSTPIACKECGSINTKIIN